MALTCTAPMFDCPAHRKTSPSSRSVSVAFSPDGAVMVRSKGVREAGVGGRRSTHRALASGVAV